MLRLELLRRRDELVELRPHRAATASSRLAAPMRCRMPGTAAVLPGTAGIVACAAPCREAGQKAFRLRFEFRDVASHRLPDDLQIDGEVSVRNAVAHEVDVFPRHIRMLGREVRMVARDVSGSFADDFDIPDHDILHQIGPKNAASLIPAV